MPATLECKVILRTPHVGQQAFIDSPAKRKVIRAGRRGGKTVGIAIDAVERFLDGKRVLYAAPTMEQVGRFWFEVNKALREPIENGVFKKNEGNHFIEMPYTEQRIKAKTAWNADTLRGDYADYLILDEWQLMNEDAWEYVGAPMLLDNNGDAVFIYTPPSLRTVGASKAKDPRHAAKLFKKAQADTTGRWESFHFSSHMNPHISQEALADLIEDISEEAYRQEILAEDMDDLTHGLIYGCFNMTTQLKTRFEIPMDWHIISGHDFGIANPAGLFFAQDKNTGDLFAYHEYLPGAKTTTFDHVMHFRELTKGRYVRKSAGGSHQEDEIRQGYIAHGWGIVEPRLQHVLPQIEKTKAFIQTNKLYVFSDMHNLIRELNNYSWKLGDDNQPIEGQIHDKAKYHLMDCLRYIISEMEQSTLPKLPKTFTWG